jgi:hypothetical protein
MTRQKPASHGVFPFLAGRATYEISSIPVEALKVHDSLAHSFCDRKSRVLKASLPPAPIPCAQCC